MHRVSASASRSLPSQDLRRYSYKLSYPDEGQHKPQEGQKKMCLCSLPERPDNWTDNTWRKYLTMMARLPCQVCKTAAVIHDLPTRSSLPVGNTTSMMRLLSKGKKHYSNEKKKDMGKKKQQQHQQSGEVAEQQQQHQQLQEAPFCTTAPASVAGAECAHPVVVAEGLPLTITVPTPRNKGAAPWDEG